MSSQCNRLQVSPRPASAPVEDSLPGRAHRHQTSVSALKAFLPVLRLFKSAAVAIMSVGLAIAVAAPVQPVPRDVTNLLRAAGIVVSGADELFQEKLSQASTIKGLNWLEAFKLVVSAEAIAARLANHDYEGILKLSASYAATQAIKPTLPGKAVIKASAIATLAALPIDLSINALNRLVQSKAVQWQIHLYILGRDKGARHAQILAGEEIPDLDIEFEHDAGAWLYSVDSFYRKGYAGAAYPPVGSQVQVYQIAQMVYEARLAASSLEKEKAQLLEDFKRELDASSLAAGSLSGTWQSGHGLVYSVSQSGTTFTWSASVLGTIQTAQGSIGGPDGTDLSVTWGPPTAGSATGKVTKVDSQHNAIAIQWSNGATFFRESPNRTSGSTQDTISSPQLGGPPSGGIETLTGTWQSGHGMVYQLSQSGRTFGWTAQAWGMTQTAQGSISGPNGRDLTVTWGPPTPGSATGMITKVDTQGNALELRWSNGVVFFRETPMKP